MPGPRATVVAVGVSERDERTPDVAAAGGGADAVVVPLLQPTPAATPDPEPPKVLQHTVEPGETVQVIAARYGVTSETVIAANRLADPDALRVGEELAILPWDGVLHVVQAGETLRQLAEHYEVDLAAIVEANPLVESADLVAAGTELMIPGADVSARAAAALLEASPRVEAVAEGAGQQGSATVSAAMPSVPAERMAALASEQPSVVAPAAEVSATAEQPEAIRALGPTRVGQASPPPVTAQYVAIVDEATGELLYGHQEHARVAPASTTKIATTIVALERVGSLDQIVTATISGSAMARGDGSSIMGLEPGEQLTLRTLLYGMMLPSGNDAAEQAALLLAGSREGYVDWMNQKMAELGLENTRFVNPSGMDARGHYSSAYDMAMLARYAMQHEAFRSMAAAGSYQGDGYRMSNLNRLIGAYEGADGVKVGRTPAAGRTMVASASRDGHRVYVTILRSEDLAGDAAELFDWVWRTFRWE